MSHGAQDAGISNVLPHAVHTLLALQNKFVFLEHNNRDSEGFSADSPSTLIGVVGNHSYLAVNVNDSILPHFPKQLPWSILPLMPS